MKGGELYSAYCGVMAQLPSHITKGEALPAWEFVNGDLALAWTALAATLTKAPKDTPVKSRTTTSSKQRRK